MSRLDVLTDALRACFTPRLMVEATGCSERSARRYCTGRSVPNIMTLAQMARCDRRIGMAIMEMLGLDHASLDREEARLRAEVEELRGEWAQLNADYQRLLAAHSAAAATASDPAAAGADAQSSAGDAPTVGAP